MNMSDEYVRVMQILHNGYLAQVQNEPFFYPHSNQDFYEPISLFAPHVTDFWFADLGYFRGRQGFVGRFGLSADEVAPVLTAKHGFKFLRYELIGPAVAELERRFGMKRFEQVEYDFILPCIRTETYVHKASGRNVRLHLRRGYGASALNKEIEHLGIFFYRGDSSEGSSTAWLRVDENWHPVRKRTRWLIHTVLDKLVDGGLFVTDGSRCEGKNNPFQELSRLSNLRGCSGEKAVAMARPFEDDEGRKFECVGYAGERNGPTLVWQVTKPPQVSE